MPTTYKNAQIQGTASTGTYATLYSTGASTTAVVSTIIICNTTSSTATYRIAIMGSAGTPAQATPDTIIAWDATVAGNDSILLTIGATLGNSRFIRVSSSANTVQFSAFVSEIT